ncbi:MAG TPA: hypothetical protein VKE74_10760 [Gemmataceae bacterium]|nr:hypothetical protein [Gemmataceae bacterium]
MLDSLLGDPLFALGLGNHRLGRLPGVPVEFLDRGDRPAETLRLAFPGQEDSHHVLVDRFSEPVAGPDDDLAGEPRGHQAKAEAGGQVHGNLEFEGHGLGPRPERVG